MGKTKILDTGWKNYLRNLNKLKNSSVEIGFFGNDSTPKGESITEYAAYNEYGTKNIPSRPFMMITHNQKLNANRKMINKGMDSILYGRTNANTLVNKIGLANVGFIQGTITTLRTPANKASTIKAKGGKTNPLINTGTMRKAVTYEVKNV